MKLSEILSGPETWCQGTYDDSHGRYCLMGALGVLLTGKVLHVVDMAGMVGNEVMLQEVSRLCRLIRRDYSMRGKTLIEWNDERFRTWEEVAAIVEKYDRDRLLNP